MASQVVVVDDHPLFRRGIVALLNDSPAFRVIADFDNGHDFLDTMASLTIDLLLLDLHMPKLSGLVLLKEAKARNNALKVVIITASDDSNELFEAITSGADGYLLKDSDPDDILQKLESVILGNIAIDPAGVTMLARHISEAAPVLQTTSSTGDLTERERQTLLLIAKGMSNKLIARELGISDGTVKVYVKNLLRKLNLGSRLALAAWAHKNADFSLE
ncbi:response regulator transcription factor [Marinomonas sp. A79]|uniref:Response regulator transcription factor n=1 Tax=Marinomonas vulgaris TaxID=2823372 RepID=A0ABS5HB24_9GAMM|nr:response regulator transcription factor [Marinomonas vulgaris]